MNNEHNGYVPVSLFKELLSKVLEVIQKLPSNESISKDFDNVAEVITEVANTLNTPPRNIELDGGIKGIDELLKQIDNKLDILKDLLKGVIRSIKIAATIFGIAILIATSVITIFKLSEEKIQLTQYTTTIIDLQKEVGDLKGLVEQCVNNTEKEKKDGSSP